MKAASLKPHKSKCLRLGQEKLEGRIKNEG